MAAWVGCRPPVARSAARSAAFERRHSVFATPFRYLRDALVVGASVHDRQRSAAAARDARAMAAGADLVNSVAVCCHDLARPAAQRAAPPPGNRGRRRLGGGVGDAGVGDAGVCGAGACPGEPGSHREDRPKAIAARPLCVKSCALRWQTYRVPPCTAADTAASLERHNGGFSTVAVCVMRTNFASTGLNAITVVLPEP